MTKTAQGLVEFVKKQVGMAYWYGTYGNKCTMSLWDAKRSQYPSQCTDARTPKAKEHIAKGLLAFDCVGLIKGYCWWDDVANKPKYVTNGCPDRSADGMYSQCKEHGSIGTIPEIPGLLVWKTGHIGVYIGEGYVVQASGFNTGVIQTLLSASPWTNWGKCPFITYDEMPEDVSVVTVEPVYVSGFVDTPNKLTLNLRAEPTKASDRLDRIPNKTSLKFLDAGSGWFKTSYKGKDGYVDSSFINYNGKTKQESLG